MKAEDAFGGTVITIVIVLIVLALLGKEPSFLLQFLPQIGLFVVALAITAVVLREVVQ